MITFIDSIPEEVLTASSDVNNWIHFLDNFMSYKTKIVIESHRPLNYALCMDKKWLVKYLADYGVFDMTTDFPLKVLQQFLLNATLPFAYKGSYLGLELYCNLLTFGKTTLNAEGFIPNSTLLLDSLTNAYVTADESTKRFFIVGATIDFLPESTVNLKIESKFFNGDYVKEANIIKEYLETHIEEFLPFSPIKYINIDYKPYPEFVYHELLNKNFV